MLDWPGGEIRFERVPIETVGTTIPVDLSLGIPWLDLSVERRTVRAVLDSGAQADTRAVMPSQDPRSHSPRPPRSGFLACR